jgi:transposase InsO family protein
MIGAIERSPIMPWKEKDVLDLRTEFALRAIGERMAFRDLCREYGVSFKTGYKWKERFIREGQAGLYDRSRRPRSSPNQLDEETVCTLIRLKMAHPHWGPEKILKVYLRSAGIGRSISLSTVKRVLDKAGLVEHRVVRSHSECGRIVNPVCADAPNQLWTVDFKGWWYSSQRERIEPLTVRDAYSRYVLCAYPLCDSRWRTVRDRFHRLFELHGLPEAIRSDNGSPFASVHSPLGLTRLSAWWVALGISLDRIQSGHPEQNGGHERMHRDIAAEVEGQVRGDLQRQQAALEVWRQEFNYERPHQALGMKVPADVYVKSPREYESGPLKLEYPLGYLTRKVCSRGTIKVANRRMGISSALAGWDVGLNGTEEPNYTVWFGPLCIGRIDLEAESFVAVR